MQNGFLQSASCKSQIDVFVRIARVDCGCNRVTQAMRAALSRFGSMLEMPRFIVFQRWRRMSMHASRHAFATLAHDCTRLGLQLYLHSALAFACNSLYRTRRFHSLCATAEKPLGLPARSTTGQKITGTQGTLGDSATARLLRRIGLQLNCTLAFWGTARRLQSHQPST
jgi:hypothetical protein